MPEPAGIQSIRIRGFRSLADVELSSLGRANILIGANGSGKSNLMRFFEMLSWMLRSRRLGEFVQRYGGGDDQLFNGSQITPAMAAEISIQTEAGRNDYRFTLAHAHPDRLMFTRESFRFSCHDQPSEAPWIHLPGNGYSEAQIVEARQLPHLSESERTTGRTITHLLRNCAIYQFHDTSDTSGFKMRWEMEDNNTLRSDGGNLAAVLHRLEDQDPHRFEMICHQIGRVLPVFDRFRIESGFGKVQLRWKARGTDRTFGAHLTSDGSLRFFALVTLLNLPVEMLPNVILLDEPELGLHPMAIALIGDMIKGLAPDVKVIVATQSPLLVDVFELEEVVVLEAGDGCTHVKRLKRADYNDWLAEGFTSGDLWLKNLIGGRP